MSDPDPRHPTEHALVAALASVARATQPQLTLVADPADPTLRASFLRWFLLTTLTPRATPLARFTLRDARVVGPLLLAGTRLRRTCAFLGCEFDSAIDLTDARVVGFEVVGGKLSALHADRLTASGSLLVRKPIQPPGGHSHAIEVERDVRLSGATIRGNADFRGCHLGTALPPGGHSVCFLADGADLAGHLLLSSGTVAHGEVRLNGVRVARNLDLSASTFRNPGGLSISAAGARVRGSAYLCRHLGDPFESLGAVRIEGATIEGDLDATGGTFVASAFATPGDAAKPGGRHDLQAFVADGVTVGAEIRFIDGFAAHGVVRLIRATVGTDLVCKDGLFDFPGEDALQADGITVEGGTFLGKGLRTTGLLRFVQARLTQGIFIDGVTFDARGTFYNRQARQTTDPNELGLDLCGVYMPEAVVGGAFYFRDATRVGPPARTVWMSIQNGRTNTVEDDAASWAAVDRIDLRDCAYQIITGLDGRTAWRLARVDQEYAPPLDGSKSPSALQVWWQTLVNRPEAVLLEARKRFFPQPYLQLATVVRAAGFETAANDILVRLERNATVRGGYGAAEMAFRWLLDAVLRYGYARWRPVWLLCAWIAATAVYFNSEHDSLRLVPTVANAVVAGVPSGHEVQFNPVIYAADTLVPLVDLGQKKEFGFREPSWLLVFNSFFGWIMTSFFAAGVSGLLRKT